MQLRGSGGEFEWPNRHICLTRNDQHVARKLRAVPRELFDNDVTTPSGKITLNALNRTLRECNCTITRRGVTDAIGELQMFSRSYWNVKRKARRWELEEMLGEEEAAKVWEQHKAKEKARKARFAAGRASPTAQVG